MDADRDLFLGVLAWQLGFVSRDALLAAARRAAGRDGLSLADELLRGGELTAAQQALLRSTLDERLQIHGGDAVRALDALVIAGPLRTELEEILRPRSGATLAFDLPTLPREATAEESEPPLSLGVPTSAGRRFRILRPHAKGGLGEVFVARDEELKREVALKQVQSRHADEPESRARFLVEAEITGGLEHPGVVPVYGLGTDVDGRPFYAMRFIRGVSLKDAVDDYHRREGADGNAGERVLQLRQLLRRVIDVCNTVEYAHSRGILHRDLKPDNIMLGTYGETLVVDWGLAKPVGQAEATAQPVEEEVLVPFSASGTSPTAMGTAVGTPAFMSPEQALGLVDRLDRPSDVYSLGATLYYLLTGRPAVDEPNLQKVLDRVKRGDFPRPREVKKSVPAALEAVVLKAMALLPAERYGSARELADDLERWLADEPVIAYHAPRSERVARWARRHRRTVLSAGAALAIVAIAAVAATVQINAAKTEVEKERDEVRRALEAEKIAKQEAREALQAEQQAKREAQSAIDNYVNLVTEERVLKDEGVQPLRKRLLQDALRYYQQLIEKQGPEGELGHELAGAILRVGRINSETGSKQEAVKAFRQALAMFEKLATEHPEIERYRGDLALTYRSLGLLESEMVRHEAARDYFDKARKIEQQLVDEHPEQAGYRRDLSLCYFRLGEAQRELRQDAAAHDSLRRALELQQKLLAEHPASVEYESDMGSTYYAMGRLEIQFERYQQALAPLGESLRIRTRLADADPTTARYTSDLAASYNSQAIAHYFSGDQVKAIEIWQQALSIRQQLAEDNPAVTSYQYDLAGAYNNFGHVYDERHDYAKALEYHRLAAEIRKKIVNENPTLTRATIDLSDSYYNVGRDQEALGRNEDALQSFRQALEVKQTLFDEHPGEIKFTSALAAAIDNVGRATASLGRHEEALGLFRRAIDLQRKAMEAEPDQPRFPELMRIHVINVAAEYTELGRPAEAVDVLRAALAEGLVNRDRLNQEPALARLRADPAFTKLAGE